MKKLTKVRATQVAFLAIIASALILGTGADRSRILASNAPDPHPGATKPVREQNVDISGWIAVHEQGTADVNITNSELDVNVTNSSLEVTGSVDVTGTVSVDNLPETQDVYVTGGNVDVTIPYADGAAVLSTRTPPDEVITYDFGETLNAFAIVLWDNSITGDNDPECWVEVLSPIAGGGAVVTYTYHDGLGDPMDLRTFPVGIPVSGVKIRCLNESLDCLVGVSVIGNH